MTRPLRIIAPHARWVGRLAGHVHLASAARSAGTVLAPMTATPHASLWITEYGQLVDAASGERLPPVSVVDPSLRPRTLLAAGPVSAWVTLAEPGQGAWFERLRVSSMQRLLEALPASLDAPCACDAGRLIEETLDGARPRRAPSLSWLLAPYRDVTVMELAAEEGVSPRTLQRQALRATGRPPKAWLRMLRLRELVASLHLDAGAAQPAALHQLARRLGFSDLAHLGRELRATCGHGLARLLQRTTHEAATLWPLMPGALLAHRTARRCSVCAARVVA